jgi:hypothetical protein
VSYGMFRRKVYGREEGPSRAMLVAWRYSWQWALRRLCLIEFLIIMWLTLHGQICMGGLCGRWYSEGDGSNFLW